MKTIKLFLPEILKECDSINCKECYLSQAQSIFGWEPIARDCFFREQFVDYEYLTGKYSRGKDMNEIELAKYKKTYKPNGTWMEIIKNKFKERNL